MVLKIHCSVTTKVADSRPFFSRFNLSATQGSNGSPNSSAAMTSPFVCLPSAASPLLEVTLPTNQAARRFWIFLARWRPDRTLTLCLLRRSLFAATATAFLGTRCFDLRAVAGICASATPTFSVTIRSVSVSAFAPARAISRNMPACVSQQMRAACDDKANHAFQGPRGLYISESLCSVFGIKRHFAIWY